MNDIAISLVIILCLSQLAHEGARSVRCQVAGTLAPSHRVESMTLNEISLLLQRQDEKSSLSQTAIFVIIKQITTTI